MTIKFFKQALFLMTIAGMAFLNSCTKDDPKLPENLVAFESDALGTPASETEVVININSLRSISTAASVSIKMEPSGVAYTTDFTTEPAAAANVVTIDVPANTTSTSLKVKKTAGALFDGDEKIKFTIETLGTGLSLGEKSVLTLSFSEIVSAGGTMEINGGGALFPNKVFIDLSGNRQTSVSRTSWDLAFSSTDDFRVVLNSPNGMMAYKLTGRTDLSTVTAADISSFVDQLSVPAVFTAANTSPNPAWLSGSIAWIDDPSGDLTKTAMAPVSVTASENVVYIINRGQGPGNPPTELGLKKIRILRNGSNYTIQYANIDDVNFQTATITKDPAYRFNYFSFTSGNTLVAEPLPKKWDIAWTGFTNSANIGYPIPYYFQDFVLQNTQAQVTALLLSTATITYENFTEANLTGLTLLAPQTTIGSTWRTLAPPPAVATVRSDRYYIVKDPDGNIYKLRFTAIITSGERGKPQFEFKLLKKA
ncbi:MAG: hypothetical protein HOP08_14240 [Cyclobacteriaceae bacterium]|nr:hypothetical protein [Cyclobacteriaceae bacterium]